MKKRRQGKTPLLELVERVLAFRVVAKGKSRMLRRGQA
jgi:hypothetical protein